jgi:broad specificity phosphatase PhoE
MKIFILRHEDRTQDCSFFSPLTKTGLENAINLVPYLSKNNINMIFCSPFIRTLQTILPYVKESEKCKINLEYGLGELHHEDIIPKKAVGIWLPEYLAESFDYDSGYKTIIKPTEISYPETEKDVVLRCKRVLKDIISKYFETDYNIILVTHQSICRTILKIVNSKSTEFKNKIDESIINNYKTGKLCKVFDGGWTYQPIN